MIGYIHVGYHSYAVGKTEFNAAMSYLLKHCVEGDPSNFTVNYSAFLVSRGSLSKAVNPSATIGTSGVVFRWSDSSDYDDNSQPTDVAMPFVYNVDKAEVYYLTTSASRVEETLTLSLPSHWSGDALQIYLGFRSDDSSKVADSVYLGSFTAA